MRRPFAVLGASALTALAVGAWAGAGPSLVLGWACAGLFLCALFMMVGMPLFRRKKALPGAEGRLFVPAALLTASLFFFLYAIAWESQAGPWEDLDERTVHLSGTLLDYPEEQYHKFYYLIRVDEIQGEKGGFVLRLSSPDSIPAEPFDRVECDAKLRKFRTGGLFSSRNTWLSKGVVLGGSVVKLGEMKVFPGQGGSFGKTFVSLRRFMGNQLSGLLPQKEASLIRAMILGEGDAVSQEVWEDFRKIGCSHLLVISGLHMTALAALLLFFLKRLPLRRVGRNLTAAGLLLCFFAVTGFPVSSLRSGLMYLLFLVGDCIGRKGDSLNSLGFAVLVICLFDPFSGGDLGFILSASSTLGILTAEPSIRKAMKKPFEKRPAAGSLFSPVISSLSVTLSALLGSLPVTILAFEGFSLLSPLANLLLALPGALLLYLSFALAFLLLIPAFIPAAMPLAFCVGWLSRFIMWEARLLAEIPGTYFSLRSDTWLIVFGAAFLLGFLALLPGGGRRSVRAAALIGACLIVAGGLYENYRWKDAVTVAAANQEGEACVLIMKNGEASALCLNGYRTAAAASLLKENNVKSVNTVFLPTLDQNACEAANALISRYPVKLLLIRENAYRKKAVSPEKTGIPLNTLSPGSRFEALEGVDVALSEDGALLSFEANGVKAALELSQAEGGECGLLITPFADSRVNSPFTVLLTDGIIEKGETPPFWKGASKGDYILSGEKGDLCLDVFRNGNVAFREEN